MRSTNISSEGSNFKEMPISTKFLITPLVTPCHFFSPQITLSLVKIVFVNEKPYKCKNKIIII